MADTVRNNIVFQGGRKVIAHLVGISDGTGENKVIKVDLGNCALFNGSRPVSAAVTRIKYNVDSFANVVLYWNRDPVDIEIMALKGRGSIEFPGGLQDPNRGGTGTGNILLSSNNPVTGAAYDIILELRLKD